MARPIIAREGWGFLAGLAVLTALAAWVHWAAALVPGLLLVMTAWFFRDPERAIPGTDRDVVAPADGRVMWVRQVDEPRFIGGPSVAISIFLSVLDVHINRAPVTGAVALREYVPGQFVAAWNNDVEQVNERAYVGISGRNYRVLVVQIAGLLARRIITWPQVGAHLSRGERYGLIRFGSCTQVYLPAGTEVLVAAGDRVAGGRSIIGRLPE